MTDTDPTDTPPLPDETKPVTPRQLVYVMGRTRLMHQQDIVRMTMGLPAGNNIPIHHVPRYPPKPKQGNPLPAQGIRERTRRLKQLAKKQGG